MGIVTEKVRQREQFNILMENWDRVKELTEESANAAGTADEKYSAYMDSMEAATKRLQNAWEGFTQSLETSTVMKWLTNMSALLVENVDKLKYIITGIAAASSAKIFDLFTNKGETGGLKGLIANIPFIGRGTKTNNILESIDKKVGNIEKGVGADSIANQTKNGGFFKRLGSFLKTGFGFGDIYDPNSDTSISRKTLKLYKQSQKGKIRLGDDFLGYTKGLTDDEREFLRLSATVGRDDAKKQMEAYNKLLKQRQRGNAAMGAVSAVITNAFTTKQVGASGIEKLFNPTDQTVEETEGDKIGRTLASGALAAIGGYFLGPLGAMLGQTIGEGAASIVSTIIHRPELEMKQRVADAKENLSRLDAIKSTMESNNSIMTEELTSSEDFEKLYKYTDDLYEKLFDLQYEGNVDIIGAINNAYETFKGVGNITSIRDLCDEINNGNANQRSMIKRQLELAEAQVNLEQLRASQEETRYEAEEKISGGFKVKSGDDNFITAFAQEVLEKYGIYQKSSSGGNVFWSQITDTYGFDDQTTPEEAYDKINEAIKALREEMPNGYEAAIKALKEFQSQIEEGVDSLKKQNKELILSGSQIGFLAADIHDLTTTELKDLTMDGVVGLVVKSLEDQGVEVRNAAGYIKDEYQDAIEKLIKSDSKFNALQQADTKTLGQLTAAQERFSSMLGKQAGLVKEYGESWEKWYDAAKRGELSDEIAKIVYAANPERIEQFARAWNTTREGLEKLTKEFPDLTTAIGLMSPSEVREYYSVFTDFFEDLAADSALTAENFEKLINQYPQLLKYYKNGTLSTELISKVNKEQQVAYGNAMLSAELSNTGVGQEFLTAVKSVSIGEANEEAARFVALTKESAATILEEIGSVKTLDEALDKANELRQRGFEDEAVAIEKLVEQYLDYDRVIEWTDPLYEKAKQASTDYFQDQITNLEEQKNALSNVNDERQKEIDLIKARDALENARKEKKRVYRRGIGFVMEADEEAITSAQENLDKLNIEKQQEDIQYQIDQLEYLKSIVENLDEEKQKQANKEALKEYFGDGSPLGEGSVLVEKITEGFAESRISINTGTGEIKDAKGNVIEAIDGLQGSKNSKAEQAANAATELNTALKGFNDLYGPNVERNWGEKGTQEYMSNVDKYNEEYGKLEEKLEAVKKAGIESGADFEAAQNIIKGGKAEDVGYRIIELDSPNLEEWDKFSGKKIKLSPVTANMAKSSDEVFSKKKESGNYSRRYNGATREYGPWEYISMDYETLPDWSLVTNGYGTDTYYFVYGGKLYNILDTNNKDVHYNTAKKAVGDISFQGGKALINELGTEAVITPGGTLTALPSKTGIVPADITKNVWALGEVAPTLVAQLGSLTQKTPTGNAGNTTYEEGQYFDNFTMNVYPAKGDDFNKILEQARAQMRLTRHNN